MASSPDDSATVGAAGTKQLRMDALADGAADCRKCDLWQERTQVVWGSGCADATVVFIGEGPGRNEDEGGQPFIGAAGKVLDEFLAAAQLDRKDIYIANVVKCRPPNNRNPLPQEIATCTEYLKAQMDVIQPAVIVTLGNFATGFVLQKKDSMTTLQGRVFQTNSRSARSYHILPLYHPAATIYDRTKREPFLAAAATLRKLLTELAAKGDQQ
ncbi:MAG: uracil-DNA glycosylase [Coriobacteriia bacterium]|nr:uracil-DNA glycosylase [Coriobacteriia bacterium]